MRVSNGVLRVFTTDFISLSSIGFNRRLFDKWLKLVYCMGASPVAKPRRDSQLRPAWKGPVPHGFCPRGEPLHSRAEGRHGGRMRSELSMRSRAEITKKYATEYAEAPKKLKSQILDQVCDVAAS